MRADEETRTIAEEMERSARWWMRSAATGVFISVAWLAFGALTDNPYSLTDNPYSVAIQASLTVAYLLLYSVQKDRATRWAAIRAAAAGVSLPVDLHELAELPFDEEELARLVHEAMQDAPHDGRRYRQARAAAHAVLKLLGERSAS